MTTLADVLSPADAFENLMRSRKSIRAFRPDPVPEVLLDRAIDMARWTPSNCNTQPWTVHLVSGVTADRMKQALVEDYDRGLHEADYPYLHELYEGGIKDRQITHIVCQQTAFGITRDNRESRVQLGRNMMTFFGAPHVALLYIPAFGNQREAADVGAFGQSLMLACSALGLGSCPMTSLGIMAGTIGRVLGVGDEVKLLYGLAIGYEDTDSAVARLDQERMPLEQFVTRYT